MGTLTTHFHGICTHVQSATRTGFAHRCVLVNGSEPPLTSPPIAPHFASLLMEASSIISSSIRFDPIGDLILWPLHGITCTYANTDESLTYGSHYQSCIPSLTSLASNLTALSRDVVTLSEPALADAYINVSSGVFDAAVTEGGATYAILTQTFEGDPVVHLTPFDNGPVLSITFHSGSTIQFRNVADEVDDDNDNDFLLHYLVLSELPATFEIPTTCTIAPIKPIFPVLNIGPGCSNSNYP